MFRVFQLIGVPFDLAENDGNRTVTDFLRLNLVTTILAGDFNVFGSVTMFTTTSTGTARKSGVDAHHVINSKVFKFHGVQDIK